MDCGRPCDLGLPRACGAGAREGVTAVEKRPVVGKWHRVGLSGGAQVSSTGWTELPTDVDPLAFPFSEVPWLG